MTPEIFEQFRTLKESYGAQSIDRVEKMLHPSQQHRDPLQKDAKWIMPGITKTPWHDPYAYPQIKHIIHGLEELHPTIKSEIHHVLTARPDDLSPYVHYQVRQDNWKAIYLFRSGEPVERSKTLLPETYKFMREIMGDWLCPLLEMHFSILDPGAEIPLHCDLWNFTINLHLGVDVPEGAGIRVANIERTWEEGKCLLFDYSYVHEAWNRSNRPRICLLMDLWHPEVSQPEREALVFLMTEIRRRLGE